MELVKVNSRRQKREYLNFIRGLYRGDNGYVCTARFNAEAMLYQKTDFAKSCSIEPVAALNNDGSICAVSCYIHNPKLPYMLIGLFEAEKDAEKAVKLIVDGAKERTRSMGLNQIVVGLNGHLSYGVGILEEGFEHKISFDSIYNKYYYQDYFEPYAVQKETLSTYRSPVKDVLKKLKPLKQRTGLTVREADLRNFTQETELLRALSNRTLDKTFLYTIAEQEHFTQQMKGLKPFLRGENLLFAVHNGIEAGFLFWHPDYNMVFEGGRDYNLLQIFLRAKKARCQSDTFKVNAIGSAGGNPFVTAALIDALAQRVGDTYEYAETTFVWDNNRDSALLNQNLFGKPYRKYGVYFIDVP